MNNRLLILIALVLAVSLAVFAFHHSSQDSDDDNANSEDLSSTQATYNGGKTLEQAREEIRDRIARFEKLTPEEWDEQLKTHPRRHGTHAEALDHAKKHLAELEAMSEAQWNAKNGTTTRQSKPKKRSDLPDLGPRKKTQGGATLRDQTRGDRNGE